MHLPLFPQGKKKKGLKGTLFPTHAGREAVAYAEERKVTNSNTLPARNCHLLLAQGMLPWEKQLVMELLPSW